MSDLQDQYQKDRSQREARSDTLNSGHKCPDRLCGIYNKLSKFFDSVEQQEASGKVGTETIISYFIVVVGMLILTYLSMKFASYFYPIIGG